ncbi:MAG: hypothetical protein HYU34_00350, partial [Candidatus Omnitrophica bacterium]|nr:hypothetical protein [Candidatus Omnitrophota bacterium]
MKQGKLRPLSLARWRRSTTFRIASLALLLNFAAFQNVYGQAEFQFQNETGSYQAVRPVTGGTPADERGSAPDFDSSPSPENLWDDHPLSRATSEAEDPNGESVSEERAVTRAAIKYTIKKTFYSNGGLKSWDKRGFNGKKLFKRYFKTFNTKGKITRSLTQDYYPNGTTVKISNDYRYNSKGIRTNRYYKVFDSQGELTRYLSQSYSADGRKVLFSNDIRYSGGDKTLRIYNTYNSQRQLTRSLTETYVSGKWVEAADELFYTKGVKTERRRNEYAAAGIRERHLYETYYDDDGSIKTRGDYSYSGDQLLGNHYSEFDADGNETSSEPVDYAEPILTADENYTFRYKVDGKEYETQFSPGSEALLEGSNVYQTTVAGYGGKAVDVEVEIVLDTAPPTGSLLISDGDEFSTSQDVTLQLEGEDETTGVSGMRFSVDGKATWSDWETFDVTKDITLPGGDGEKEVWAAIRDEVGNEEFFSDTLILDLEAPTGLVEINGGDPFTKSASVTLDLTADDEGTGVEKMRFSQDGQIWTDEEDYATSKDFNLNPGDGDKQVYVQFKDGTGRWSDSFTAQITLDTTAPVITPEDLPAGNQVDLPYLVVPFRIDDVNPELTEDFVTKELVEGENEITLQARDLAGNETETTVTIEYLPPDRGLTDEEKSLRQRWLEENSKYFTEAEGIDPASGFPIDLIGPSAPEGVFWTQPTSIGFYLHFLGEIISKRLVLPDLSQGAAVIAAEKTLTTLLDVQSRFGWRGLIPWLRLDGGVRPDRSEVASIDNANLTHHLAAFLGLLEKGNLQKTIAASLYQKAKDFIDAQQEGYESFVDPVFGVLRGVYNTVTQSFDNYADRFGSEIRASIPFLIEYFNLPQTIWTQLIRSTSAYPTRQGRRVETFSAFDGGAFQYFWPLLVSPEESLPKIKGALENALLIFNDFLERKVLAGFPSAASLPEGGYSGKLGIDFLKETSDSIDETVASVYGLAAAYRLNPAWVLSKIQEIEQAFPGLTAGPLGFYDSMRIDGGVSQNYYAIDQGSFLLGLLGTGAGDFQSFLERRGSWTGYESHYEDLDLNIQSAVSGLPEPAMTQEEIDARDGDSASLYEAGYDFDDITGNGIEVEETAPGIFTYIKTAPSGWIGGFVNPAFDRDSFDYVVLEARSLAAGTSQVRLELKDNQDFLLKETLRFDGTGWHTFQFFFPKDTPTVNFIAFADPTSDFEVRSLHFSDEPVFQGTFPPVIVQTSPLLTNASDYQLTYTVNGFVRTENIQLALEGENLLERRFKNTFEESTAHTFAVTLDRSLPTGSVSINDNDPYATSRDVTLTLEGNDETSGIDQM